MKTLIRTSLLLFLGGLCFGQSNPGAGGSGAPASVTLLSKTGTYAGSTSDFSNGSTPPTVIEFSLSAIGQTYTLLSSAPTKVGGNMPCTILKECHRSLHSFGAHRRQHNAGRCGICQCGLSPRSRSEHCGLFGRYQLPQSSRARRCSVTYFKHGQIEQKTNIRSGAV
jgi:hypothetical protein